MPDTQEYTYDVFISYAREDYSWVCKELHAPLTQCVGTDGRAPRVFLDQSSMGVGIGEDFTEALARAILGSRRIILVYSKAYFSKEMTQWELTKAFQMDPTGRQGRILPILLDPEAMGLIPLSINHINYLNVQDQHWLPRLQAFLGLKTAAVPRDMAFGAPVADIVVNNTLPPVTVLLSDRGKPGAQDEMIELDAPGSGLQGTLRKKSHDGIAVFADLSFRTAADSVSLTAKALGHRDAVSRAFVVQPLKTVPRDMPRQGAVSIPGTESARALLFGGGQGCAVVNPGHAFGKAAVYDSKGQVLGKEVRLPAHPRFCQTSDQSAAVVDWKGDVLQLHADGETCLSCLRPDDVPFAVPGHVAYTADGLLVGMWNGDLFRIDRQGNKARLLQHPHGIQSFVAGADGIILCDFFGNLISYQGEQSRLCGETERIVRGMGRLDDKIVIIGETQVYQFCPAEGRLTPWLLRTGRIVQAMPIPGAILVLDTEGRGMCLDQELVMQSEFHVTAGAVPVCAGQMEGDTYVVFAYPDGTSALMKNTQIVYTHPAGFLGFDARLQTVVVYSGAGLMVHAGAWLTNLCGKSGT